MYVKLTSERRMSDNVDSRCFPDKEIFNRHIADVRLLSGTSIETTFEVWKTWTSVSIQHNPLNYFTSEDQVLASFGLYQIIM